MKKLLKFSGLLLLSLPLLTSCGSSENKQKQALQKDTTRNCFIANFEGDTAMLNLKITDTVNVEGTLLIKYANSPQNDGTIKGKFKGDTLYVDYFFKKGTEKGKFLNPLAFLKKDSTLVMGVGQIETAYGRSYFVRGKAINYERGKFTFLPNHCK